MATLCLPLGLVLSGPANVMERKIVVVIAKKAVAVVAQAAIQRVILTIVAIQLTATTIAATIVIMEKIQKQR